MDIVLGAITNYNFDQIKPWVTSLDQSGFKGVKALLCYNIPYSVTNELESRGYSTLCFQKNDAEQRYEYAHPNFSIVLDRFIHTWTFLSRLEHSQDYRYLLLSDVKDVIFQKNPSDFWDTQTASFIGASESIQYEFEPWGEQNMIRSFGQGVYEKMAQQTIINAGTISGLLPAMLDFCLQVYLTCSGSPRQVPGGGGPDQAALNILLRSLPYQPLTRVMASEEGWAAQLGTTGDPTKTEAFQNFLLEPRPIFQNGLVCTSEGTPFYLVHQYDRVPAWKNEIEMRYQ